MNCAAQMRVGDDAERCEERAEYELHGIRMCAGHYIEALEHSAHLNFGKWNGLDFSLQGDARVKEALDALKRKRGEEIRKSFADRRGGR